METITSPRYNAGHANGRRAAGQFAASRRQIDAAIARANAVDHGDDEYAAGYRDGYVATLTERRPLARDV